VSIDVTYYSFIIVRISDTMVVVMAITNVWHSTAITMLTVFIIVVVRLSIYGKWSCSGDLERNWSHDCSNYSWWQCDGEYFVWLL